MNNSETKINLLDDSPATEDHQIWKGLNSYAERLTDILPSLPSISPVLINGDWGSGKTTLLKTIQRKLEGKDTHTQTIWFDAWRYESEIALLPALIRTVWDAAPDDVHDDEDTLGFFNTAWKCAVTVGMRVAPILAEVAGAKALSSLLDGMSPSKLDNDIQTFENSTTLKPQPDPTEQLWETFSKILEKSWPGKSIIIIIDDLDRCSPEGSVELLDGLRLLISSSQGNINCRFVVALDKKVVSSAVSKKFSNIGGYDGNRYLEKIFPLSFDIPVPNDREVALLLKTFLKETHDSEEPQHNDQRFCNQRDALSEALRDPLFNNPRLMKRCINRFNLVIMFEEASGDSVSFEINYDRALAKWIAATERWPNLRRLVRTRDQEYWEQVAKVLHDPSKAMPDDEATFLLKEQGARVWVQREMLGTTNIRTTEFLDAETRMQRWGL